jgi:hypothetical protein
VTIWNGAEIGIEEMTKMLNEGIRKVKTNTNKGHKD